MKGKFRKRSNAVWCPKPKDKRVYDTVNKDTVGKIKHCKVSGWQMIDYCDNCPHLEEYHVEEQGVFCLYPKTKFDYTFQVSQLVNSSVTKE
jgi:hypothetical protein